MRRVALLALTAVLLAGLAMVDGPGAGASPNPTDALLDRARAALADHEFEARVDLRWWDGSRHRREEVSVVAVDGTLRVADGEVVSKAGRAWVRTDDRWRTLWSDARDPGAPSIGSKYRTSTGPGPVIVGRPTRQLTVRHHGDVVERISVDRELGIVLGRERLDRNRVITGMRFVMLRDLRPRWGDAAAPARGNGAPRRSAPPADAARRVGDGFVLTDTRRLDDDESLRRYSDGVFEASVFVRTAPLDWSSLPDHGESRRIGGVRVRRYGTPAGRVVVFESAERTYTLVTDAPTSDQSALVADLASASDAAWTRFVRSVTGPFRWD
jgi:hypothetical protein